jgi:hypothetical protein
MSIFDTARRRAHEISIHMTGVISIFVVVLLIALWYIIITFGPSVLRTYRLRKSRCPYCNAPFRAARIRGRGRSLYAILCPDQHSGFLFPNFDAHEQTKSTVKTGEWYQVDLGGEHLGIPGDSIEWGNPTPTPRRQL